MSSPTIIGMPEVLCGVDNIERREGNVTARMQVGRWMLDPTGRPAPSALGVLADNLLGYAIIDGAPPPEGWAVTTEMSMDVVEVPPSDGSPLRGEATLLETNRSGGLASGRITDSAGLVIARVRQRGRFVAVPSNVTDRAPGSARLRSGMGLPDLALKAMSPGLLCELVVDASVVNPLGNLHGGVSLWLAGTVGSAALREGNPSLATASIHVTYLRPAPLGTTVRVIATVVHTGRSLGLAHVTALLGDGRPCTQATVVGHVI